MRLFQPYEITGSGNLQGHARAWMGLAGSVTFGMIVGWLAEMLSHPDSVQWLMGLVAGVIGLQLSEISRVQARTPLLAKLEGALTDSVLYPHLQKLVDANAEWHRLMAFTPECLPLFEQQRIDLLTRAQISLQEMANGRMSVSDPDQQYVFAIDLVSRAKKKVCAVSYRDDEFWEIEAGVRYLEHNRALIASSGAVQRIFVADDAEKLLSQRQVMEHQIAAGIEVFVIPPARLEPTDKEDFVVYDGRFVRYAEPVEFKGSRKRATLSVDAVEVVQYGNRFTNMLLRSIKATDYFTRIDTQAIATH